MTFSEALYYLITQDNDYILGRDIDPSKVSTSIAQGFKYPEKISTQRTLDKLKMIIDLANAYKKETKDIYIRKYLKSEKAQKISLMELEDRNIAKADKDSLPIYGASVSLNEWRKLLILAMPFAQFTGTGDGTTTQFQIHFHMVRKTIRGFS